MRSGDDRAQDTSGLSGLKQRARSLAIGLGFAAIYLGPRSASAATPPSGVPATPQAQVSTVVTIKPPAVAPTATPKPPTATPIPPTATPKPPTATPKPPTAIPATSTPTATPKPPTATPIPPTATPKPPTATSKPPTAIPATPAPTVSVASTANQTPAETVKPPVSRDSSLPTAPTTSNGPATAPAPVNTPAPRDGSAPTAQVAPATILPRGGSPVVTSPSTPTVVPAVTSTSTPTSAPTATPTLSSAPTTNTTSNASSEKSSDDAPSNPYLISKQSSGGGSRSSRASGNTSSVTNTPIQTPPAPTPIPTATPISTTIPATEDASRANNDTAAQSMPIGSRNFSGPSGRFFPSQPSATATESPITVKGIQTAVPRKPATMLTGTDAFASGVIGLPSQHSTLSPTNSLDRGLQDLTPSIPTTSLRPPQRSALAGKSSISAGIAAFGLFGGQGSTGAVINRGSSGAGPIPNDQSAAHKRSDWPAILLGLGLGALLLLGIGFGLRRREAILAAGGWRL